MNKQAAAPSNLHCPLPRRGAFSLVELVIVIVIIGIIAAIAVPRFGAATQGADLKAAKSSLIILQNAIELFNAETGAYPSNLSDLASTATCVGGGTCGPYLRGVPSNPLTGTTSVVASASCDTTQGWGYDAATGSICACDPTTDSVCWDESLN